MAANSLMKLYSSTMLWDHLRTATSPEMAWLSVVGGFRLAYCAVILNQPCQKAAWIRLQVPYFGPLPWVAWCAVFWQHGSPLRSWPLLLDVEIEGRSPILPSSLWSWQRLGALLLFLDPRSRRPRWYVEHRQNPIWLACRSPSPFWLSAVILCEWSLAPAVFVPAPWIEQRMSSIVGQHPTGTSSTLHDVGCVQEPHRRSSAWPCPTPSPQHGGLSTSAGRTWWGPSEPSAACPPAIPLGVLSSWTSILLLLHLQHCWMAPKSRSSSASLVQAS